jgi:O-antigen/teichoic acid export membrane protein
MEVEKQTIVKQRQIRDSVLYMLPLVASNLFPFLTLPIFTRILTKEDYGILALAQVYAVFVSGLANFGMSLSYERNYFQYRESPLESAQLMFSSLAFVVANCAVLGTLTYLFRNILAEKIIGAPGYGDILFYAFLSNCMVNFTAYYQIYFRNTGKAFHYVGFAVAMSLLNLIASLYLVAFLRVGVIGLVYAHLVASGVAFLIMTAMFVRTFPVSLNRAILRESIRISYPLTPRIFMGAVSQQFDKYMIGLLSTLGSVGVYRIGQQVAFLVFSYMTQLENVFIPQTYRRMFDLKEKGKEATGQYLTPFFYVSIAMALMVSLFAEEAISILTPSSFHGAIDIVIILSMYYGFLFFGKITGTQLLYMKKTHITSLLTFFSLGLNIGLNIPFIMKWGALGAAWGTCIAGILSSTISFLVAQRYYGIKWEYPKIGAILLIFFSSAILMVLLRDLVHYPFRLTIKLAFIMFYIYFGVKIRVITPENLYLLKNLIRFKGSFSLQPR